jgi:hypothetical protein
MKFRKGASWNRWHRISKNFPATNIFARLPHDRGQNDDGNHRQRRMLHCSEPLLLLPNATAGLAQESDAARRDVTVNVITSAQEDDAVTGRVGLIVFQLVIWNHNSGSDVYMLTA